MQTILFLSRKKLMQLTAELRWFYRGTLPSEIPVVSARSTWHLHEEREDVSLLVNTWVSNSAGAAGNQMA